MSANSVVGDDGERSVFVARGAVVHVISEFSVHGFGIDDLDRDLEAVVEPEGMSDPLQEFGARQFLGSQEFQTRRMEDKIQKMRGPIFRNFRSFVFPPLPINPLPSEPRQKFRGLGGQNASALEGVKGEHGRVSGRKFGSGGHGVHRKMEEGLHVQRDGSRRKREFRFLVEDRHRKFVFRIDVHPG
jgi:hypothetical protein